MMQRKLLILSYGADCAILLIAFFAPTQFPEKSAMCLGGLSVVTLLAILGWFFANNHADPSVREKDRSNYQVFFDTGIMPERFREAFLKRMESRWLEMLVVTIVISNIVTAIVAMSCFRGG